MGWCSEAAGCERTPRDLAPEAGVQLAVARALEEGFHSCEGGSLRDYRPECRTRRSSESEPADSLRDKCNATGGWLRSLTFSFGGTTRA